MSVSFPAPLAALPCCIQGGGRAPPLPVRLQVVCPASTNGEYSNPADTRGAPAGRGNPPVRCSPWLFRAAPKVEFPAKATQSPHKANGMRTPALCFSSFFCREAVGGPRHGAL